jgi:hypothetical protein
MGNDRRPVSTLDAVIEVYKKDVDRTLLRTNLALSPEQRIRKLQDFVRGAIALRAAALAGQHFDAIAALEALHDERSR